MDWVIHYIHNTGTKFWSFCRVLTYQSSINTHSCLHFTTATWTPLYLAEYSFTVSLIRITIRNTHTHTHTHLLFISRNTIFLKIIYLRKWWVCQCSSPLKMMSSIITPRLMLLLTALSPLELPPLASATTTMTVDSLLILRTISPTP